MQQMRAVRAIAFVSATFVLAGCGITPGCRALSTGALGAGTGAAIGGATGAIGGAATSPRSAFLGHSPICL